MKKIIISACSIAVAVLLAFVEIAFISPIRKKLNNAVHWDDDVLVISAITSTAMTDTQWGLDEVSLNISNNLFELQGVEGKTKAAFDIEYVTQNWTDRFNILLTGNTLPDVILGCDNETLEQLIESDAAVKLDDYINQEGKYLNIKKYFDQSRLNAIAYKDNSSPEKSGIYGFNAGINEVPTAGDWYIQVQYRLLDWYAENHNGEYPVIGTLDNLYNLVNDYITAHPDQDDIGVLIPLSGSAAAQNAGNTAMRLGGKENDGYFQIDPESLQAQYTMTSNEMKQFAKWLNKCANTDVNNARGAATLLDRLSFTSLYPDIRAQAALGNVLVCIEPDWQLNEAEQALAEGDKMDCRYAKVPIYFDGVDATKSQVANYDAKVGSWKAVITKNCQNVEAVLQFFDFLWSEEGQIATKWGVEDVHYEIVDGKRVMKEEVVDDYFSNVRFKQETGIGLYSYWSQGGGALADDGQYIDPFSTPEMIARGYKDKDKEVIAKYGEAMGITGAKTWLDLWADGKQMPWGLAYNITIPSADADDKNAKKAYNVVHSNKCSEKIVPIIECDASQFEAKWEEWVTFAYSSSINTGAPVSGVGYREWQYEKAIRNRLKEWYPITYAEWLGSNAEEIAKPTGAGVVDGRTIPTVGNLNWFEADLSVG